MLKHVSFYVLFVFAVAVFMTAGCAKQDVVKKDEGFAPAAAVARQGDQPKISETAPSKHDAAAPSDQITIQPAVSAPQVPDSSSFEQLQSALKTIYFNLDSNDLSESARSILTKNAAVLMKESSAKIRIEGSCDERGSAEYNLALGERRAKAAQQYFITLGIKSDRLATISYGKEKPAVQGSNETAWAKNRRDEFVVVSK